jgi:hypothetical protein
MTAKSASGGIRLRDLLALAYLHPVLHRHQRGICLGKKLAHVSNFSWIFSGKSGFPLDSLEMTLAVRR